MREGSYPLRRNRGLDGGKIALVDRVRYPVGIVHAVVKSSQTDRFFRKLRLERGLVRAFCCKSPHKWQLCKVCRRGRFRANARESSFFGLSTARPDLGQAVLSEIFLQAAGKSIDSGCR